MRFYKLVKYDIVNGILRKAYLYLIPVVICVAFFLDFYVKVSAYDRDGAVPQTATVINCLFYFFKGKEPFHPEEDVAFQIPAAWLLLFLYAAFLTLDYPYRNLTGNGTQVVIRVRTRNGWWMSKCLWLSVCTLLYFLILYAVIFLLCLLCGIGFSTGYSDSINEVAAQMELAPVSFGQAVMLVFVLPVLVALAVNCLQMCLGLFLERTYCYLVSTVLLFASAYFQTPPAIGNFAMVKRSIFCPEGEMVPVHGVVLCAVIIFVSVVVGFVRIEKYDIIKKSS